MTSAPAEYRVASVVLNYNSDADLQVSVPQLCAQQGIHHAVIIVDNASTPECVQRTQDWLREEYPDAIIGTVAEVEAWVQSHPRLAQENGRVYLMLNHENRGYSAGNNIGIRLGIALDSEAVLIVNPDVRISENLYIASLAARLFSDPECVLAASAMHNLSGVNENPMREPGFIEELFWPIWMILTRFGFHPPSRRKQPGLRVEKISGSCLLARSSFLTQIGLLDEGVFLYCEEAILAAQVRESGKRIHYAPDLEAVHAHVGAAKGDPVKRFLAWARSRSYYHRRYTGYGPIRRALLQASQASILGLIYLKQLFQR